MLREANWKDRIMYAIGKRKIFRVQGDSMLPTLKDGDKVMILPTKSIAPGDVVLASHPYKSSVKMLKRVSEITDAGRYSLIGDNPAKSTDSRTFGSLSIECIQGKAVCRISK
jgi:nickel-type superoxide dismutase maturation protease